MATVISKESITTHAIDKYNFKILAIGSESDEEFVKSSLVKDTFSEANNPGRRGEDIDSSALSKSSKDSLIESLMKKTDEMSSNFIKLQMKLEDKESEYLQEIAKVKEESFNEGVEAGLQKAQENNKNSLVDGIAQFSSSVLTLDNSAKEFNTALQNIKNDLINAALDISKEVVSTELSINSNEIASKLGDELITELQGASKITLRVNPKNHGSISEHTGALQNVVIVSDSAVNEGGVVAISDVGNIDSQINKRFEKVRRAALSEV